MNLLNKKIDNYILSLLNVEYIEETKAHNDGTIDIYLNKNKLPKLIWNNIYRHKNITAEHIQEFTIHTHVICVPILTKSVRHPLLKPSDSILVPDAVLVCFLGKSLHSALIDTKSLYHTLLCVH